MPYLRYYTAEHARHPTTFRARCSQEEAIEGTYRILAHFLSARIAQSVRVEFFGDGRRGNASFTGRRIRLGRALDWLLVIHEAAHVIHMHRTGWPLPERMRWHGKVHARLVDRLEEFIDREGWLTGSLAHEIALRDLGHEAAVQRQEERKAVACTPDARIERRRVQVKRLETKIKSLTTRLKSAQRSLAALERAKARREACTSQRHTS